MALNCQRDESLRCWGAAAVTVACSYHAIVRERLQRRLEDTREAKVRNFDLASILPFAHHENVAAVNEQQKQEHIKHSSVIHSVTVSYKRPPAASHLLITGGPPYLGLRSRWKIQFLCR